MIRERLAVIPAAVLMAVSMATADDVVLMLQHGPGAGDLSLAWTGGAPVYEVLRATQPGALHDPERRVAETAGTSWVDQPPAGEILYYEVVSRGCGCPSGAPDCEVEPNDSADRPTDLTSSALPIVVRGCIQGGADEDSFGLRLTAGSLVRVTAGPQTGSLLDAAFEVTGLETQNLHFRRTGRDDAPGGLASRQVFVPVTGEYLLRLADEGGAGAPGGAYSLTVVTEPEPLPQPITVGSSTAGQVLNGNIGFYSIAPAAVPVQATAVARQLAVPSDLDTLVTIWDPIAGMVIAEVNDGDIPSGPPSPTSDARVAWRAAGGQTYLVLVDHDVIEPPGSNTTYRLDIATVSVEGATTEVNDRQSTSYPLTLPQAPFTSAMRNTLSIDWDVYSVHLTGSQATTVWVTGGVVNGAEQLPYYIVADEHGLTRRLGAFDNSFNARNDFFPGIAGTYYVFVTDYRYLAGLTTPPFRPVDAAGTFYRIDLLAAAGPNVELGAVSPVSLTIATAGSSRWHLVSHPRGLLLARGIGTVPFQPVTTIWKAETVAAFTPRIPMGGILSDIVGLHLPAGTYVIESTEQLGVPGSYVLEWQSIDLGWDDGNLATDSDTADDSTVNDTCATADPLPGLPGAGLGRLEPGDADSYAFTAPSTVATIRTAAGGLEFVDTALSLYRIIGGAPTLIATNDDENAAMGQYYSRIAASGLVAGDTYCVRVIGKTPAEAGAYSMIVTPD